MDAGDYVQQGNERIRSSDYPTAIACFDAALRLDPINADAHFGRGLANYQLRDNETAEAAFTACIQLQPDVPGVLAAYAMRCLARANLSDRRGAMDDYQEVVSRDPKMTDLFHSQLCVGTAQVVVLAEAYPSQIAMIIELLTRA